MIVVFLELLATLVTAQHIANIQEVEIKHPQFDGTGYLELAHLTNIEYELNFTLTFRPESNESLLLFSAQTITADTNFVAVVLKNGFVVFRFDCGSGINQLTSVSSVNLNVWNTIIVARIARRVRIQVNNEIPYVESYFQGCEGNITLNLNLYVGGFKNMLLISRRLDTTHQFVGCIQELLIKGRKVDFRKTRPGKPGESQIVVNVEECKHCPMCENNGTCTAMSADRSVCVCPLGFNGVTCAESEYATQFMLMSYMEFPGLQSVANFTDIEIVFKAYDRDGLLLYVGLDRRTDGDFLSLSLQDGFIEFSFDLGGGRAILRSLNRVTLHSWHLVRASRSGQMGTLKVDDEAFVTGQSPGANYYQLNELGLIHIGGHRNYSHTTSRAGLFRSLYGCIQKVSVNNISFDLINGASSKWNVTRCSDLCDGVPCLNDELYRRFLYKVSGLFGNITHRRYEDNVLFSGGSDNIDVSVTPINITIFPNKQTFFVVQRIVISTYQKYVLTLQYIKERLVQVERHYIHPSVYIPHHRTASNFYNTLSWRDFNNDTYKKNCGGYIYLINSTNVETVGTLNNCEGYIRDSPKHFLNITCSKIIATEVNPGNINARYYEYTLTLLEKYPFPAGWRVTPC